MTYRKIAQLAGVSASTVSKALSGSPEISQETAERIRRIAEENGVIRPKYHRDRPSTRIAVIVPEIVSVYYSQTVSELVSELRRFGIEPYMYLCGFEEERFCKIMDLLADEQLTDGIIALTNMPYPHHTDIPMVRLTSFSTDCCCSIDCDMESGIFEAVGYLYALGHRRIGFIGEENTRLKLKYFQSSCERLGVSIDPALLYMSQKRFEEIGTDAAEYYMSLPKLPTGLLAAYDEVALGAIHTFTKNGIRIPEDISIIGINDIPSASYASVPLTTIRTYASEIIHLSVKHLLDCIKRPGDHMSQQIKVKCKLIIRDTTARIPPEISQ